MPLSTGNVFFMLEVVKVPHLVADCAVWDLLNGQKKDAGVVPSSVASRSSFWHQGLKRF